MKLDYFVMAETIAEDASGVFSAIRLNQNVFSPASLPAVTKRAFILNLIDEDGSGEGASLSVVFEIVGPSGDVLSTQRQQITLGARRYEDLPGLLLIPIELVLELTEYGTYTIRADVETETGATLRAERLLYVRSSGS